MSNNNAAGKSESRMEFIKPVVVLLVICLIVAALLSFTNSITEPIILQHELEEAEKTRAAVLPGAGSFTEIECDLDSLGITGAYREDSGLGYVMTAAYKGYGGLVTVTVGLDETGTVVGISADVSTETTGVGSKAGQSAYLDKYMGISGSAQDVDTIASATYSSTAVKTGVNAILAAFEKVKEE